jgi:hypothetical protein
VGIIALSYEKGGEQHEERTAEQSQYPEYQERTAEQDRQSAE